MNKKVIGTIILIIALGSILFFELVFKGQDLTPLKADTGWDSSYDYGSSSDYGSSYGGSYGDSYGSSSRSRFRLNFDDDNRSSSSNSSKERTYRAPSFSPIVSFIVLIIVIIIAIIIIHLIKKDKNTRHFDPNIQEHILKDNPQALEEIKKEIPDFDKEAFYDYVYKNFVDLQTAWMNFDYDALRKLVTDELFNTYKSQLKVLENKKQKNIMSDFTRSDIAIIKYYKADNKHNIMLKMTVRFFDYLVDKNNKVIRGNDLKRIVMTYKLTYVGSIDTNNKKTNKCPNCNAPLDNNTSSNVCPYCRSTIISNQHNFILSKKETFEQRME